MVDGRGGRYGGTSLRSRTDVPPPGLDRVELEGHRAGLYVRVRLEGVPAAPVEKRHREEGAPFAQLKKLKLRGQLDS